MRCHSSSTTLGARTGYWKPTQRGTDETLQRQDACFKPQMGSEINCRKQFANCYAKEKGEKSGHMHQQQCRQNK